MKNTKETIFNKIRSIILSKKIEDEEKELRLEKLRSELDNAELELLREAITMKETDLILDIKGGDIITSFSLMHYAVIKNSLPMVNYLTKLAQEEGGAELKNRLLNMRDVKGETALHNAVCFGEIEIIQKLINSGADIDAKDNSLGTPLLKAASFEGSEKVCELLIELDADTSAVDVKGESLIHKIARTGMSKLIDPHIVSKVDINLKSKSGGQTALHYAARCESSQCLEELLKLGADPNLRNEKGELPMHFAIKQDVVENVRILADARTNVSQVYENIGSVTSHVKFATNEEIKLIVDQARITQQNLVAADPVPNQRPRTISKRLF